MITYDVIKYKEDIASNGSFKFKTYFEGKCLSTDTKPTEDVVNGSVLLEMDTSKIYMFDESGIQWMEVGGVE